MSAKSEFLQIRVSAAEKNEIRRAAKRAGLGISAWVLTRVLPGERAQFARLVRDLGRKSDVRLVYAAIHDLLATLPKGKFCDVTESVDVGRLGDEQRGYLSAMVEHTAHRKNVSPPDWVKSDGGFGQSVGIRSKPPVFGTELKSLRLELLLRAPVAFRRRNIFVSDSVGARV